MLAVHVHVLVQFCLVQFRSHDVVTNSFYVQTYTVLGPISFNPAVLNPEVLNKDSLEPMSWSHVLALKGCAHVIQYHESFPTSTLFQSLSVFTVRLLVIGRVRSRRATQVGMGSEQAASDRGRVAGAGSDQSGQDGVNWVEV